MATNFDIKSNMCEVCGKVASAGILDDEKYIQTRIRYTCQDHYTQIYERIKKGE
jgi:hypothetical protein